MTLARIAAAVLALLLVGCASQPPAPLPQLASVPAAFEMSGRIAVRQADRSEIAKLRWTHRPAGDVWVLASPLGNEVARIESSAAGATLTPAAGSPETAPSFAALAARILGVALDPRDLAAWLHGSAPEAAGWALSIDERERAGAVEIARRMSATRGDVVVRLVVDEYRALPE